jgi:hypothetical protein
MAISLATARKWCTESEFALVTASVAGTGVAWTPATLKAKIERTRKLRDKNRDRHRQLRRTNRAVTGAKSGSQVSAMAVFDKKARLFDEALARFVAKLEKLNARRRLGDLKSAVAKALVRKRAVQAAGGKAGKAGKSRSKGAGAARKAGRDGVVPAAVQLKRTAQMARVRARNARNQAKRDARGG